MRDRASGAVLADALVVAEPTGRTASTAASGRATFADLAIGTYRFTTSVPGLTVSGATVGTGANVDGATGVITVVADANLLVALPVQRFDPEALNLDTIHKSGAPGFSNQNCIVCHGDRKGEVSTDPAIQPFHAIFNGTSGHSLLPCTFCHTTVDLVSRSSARLRKQVNVSTCQGCHANYPNAF